MEIVLSSMQIWVALGIMAGAFTAMITLVLLVISSKFDGLDRRLGLVEQRLQGIEVVLMKPPKE